MAFHDGLAHGTDTATGDIWEGTGLTGEVTAAVPPAPECRGSRLRSCGGVRAELSPARAPRHGPDTARGTAGAAGPSIRHLISADCLPFVNDYVREQLLSHRAENEKFVQGSGCQLVRDFFFFFFLSHEAVSSTATHFVAVPDSLSSPWVWSAVGQ